MGPATHISIMARLDDRRATHESTAAVPASTSTGRGGEQGLQSSASAQVVPVEGAPATGPRPPIVLAKQQSDECPDTPPHACGVLHRVHDQACECDRCLPPMGQGMPREMQRMAFLSAQVGWPLAPAPEALDARRDLEASWSEARRNAELNSKAPWEAACVDRNLLQRLAGHGAESF